MIATSSPPPEPDPGPEPDPAADPHRTVAVGGAFNFRDLGGRLTAAGLPVAAGRIYRSASLDEITDEGLATLEQLGIRTVIDLRSQGEIDRNGRFPHERLPVRWVHVSSGFAPPAGPADPRSRAFLEHPDPMSVLFRVMVTEGRSLLVDALRIIAEPDTPPLVFHCTSGKDRTGLLAVLIQLIAGVDLDDALEDFEHSAEAVRLHGHDVMRRFPGIDQLPPERVARLHAADRAWVLGALEEIGGPAGLEAWLDSVGIDAGARASIRSHLAADGSTDRITDPVTG